MSTDALPAKDRMGQWSEWITQQFGGLQSDLYGDTVFDGHMQTSRAGQVILTKLEASRHRVVRTPQMARTSEVPYLKIVAPWQGQAQVHQMQREAKADLAVIVTTCPPAGLRGIGQVDGIWACETPFAIAIATALRQGLVATANLRLQQTNSADKMAMLYEHLCSVPFRQNIEAIVESFKGLKDQLDAEKRAFAKQWKEREFQLEKAITHTAALYGGIQGIAGREALPEIRSLALPM